MTKMQHQKILKLAEFDENAYEGTVRRQGARFENARLRPLIQSLLERIEALEGALGEVANEPNNSDYYLNHAAQTALEKHKTAMEELAKGEL